MSYLDSDMSYLDYNMDMPSLVAVAYNEEWDLGVVLCGVGGGFELETYEAGERDMECLGLTPPKAGIWIWEGQFIWTPGPYEYPQDGDMNPVGSWRRATDHELAALVNGTRPWNEEDWKTKR